MKKRYLPLLLILSLAPSAFADDTDIYGVANIDVTPNVLIVFDNSGSMGRKDVPADVYDPSIDYSYAGGVISDTVYHQTWTCTRWRWGRCRQWASDYDSIFFDDTDPASLTIDSTNWLYGDAQTELQTKGYFEGLIREDSSVVSSSTNSADEEHLRFGNYINFLDTMSSDTLIRMVVAKEVVADLIYNNIDKVDFGIMKFNDYNTSTSGGFITAEVGASQSTLIGNYDPNNAAHIFTDSDQTSSFGAIGSLKSDTWTPLAETLGEAGLYFAGKKSWWNAATPTDATSYPLGRYNINCMSNNIGCQDYSSHTPISVRCQKNYIIMMTDGEPTEDNDKFGSNNYIGTSRLTEAADDDNTNYLDDVADYIHNTDLMPIGTNPTEAERIQKGTEGDFPNQTVTTYTIGFQQELDILQSTADRGGGEYYTANNASTLGEALNSIISTITKTNESFSAAAVPVSRANKAYAGEYVYYGLFQPLTSGNWIGNLKKYGITNMGEIQDINGNNIVTGGSVSENAQSFWSTTPDGPAVDKGGAGEVLYDAIKAGFTRKLYTYTGTDSALTATSNAFTTGNTELTTTNYSGLTTNVISAVRREDRKTWPLGSLIHSQPLVLHYNIDDADPDNDKSMLFAGANDGMLHCIDDTDGLEKWGFIPPDLLGNLASLENPTELQYFVDEAPVSYTYTDTTKTPATRQIILFGERRGGYNFNALDVTNYDSPEFQYSVTRDILRYDDGTGTSTMTGELLGQSWGKPQHLRMATAESIEDTSNPGTYLPTPTVEVFLMPGGYDTNQDKYDATDSSVQPAATDSNGRALFAIGSQTGALFDLNASDVGFNFSADAYSAIMTHSIISTRGFENPHTRTTTRVYAGDMNGNMFAVRDDINHLNKDRTVAGLYAGDYDGREDGVWGQAVKLFSTPGQKIFYSPNALNEYFMVYFNKTNGKPQVKADQISQYHDSAVPEASKDLVYNKRVGEYLFYGTGDRANPDRKNIRNGFYAVKNNWQWNASDGTPTFTPSIVKAYVDPNDLGKIKKYDGDADPSNDVVLVDQQRDADGKLAATFGNGEYFILDVTDDLFQNSESDVDTSKLYTNYIVDAITHPNNRGWYFDLLDDNGNLKGEKVVSSPIIFGGIIYFTTYTPADTSAAAAAAAAADPCGQSGAEGIGKFYAIGYKYGEAARNHDDPDDPPKKKDRKKTLDPPGIPPEPVLVVHEGKPTIIVGFETEDPVTKPSLEQFYWRQVNQ